MIAHIETYLINFSFIVIPLFIYQMFWVMKHRKTKKKNQWIITVCLTTSALLCMYVPLRTFDGFIFDFRFIPFILSIFYGGISVSLPIYIVVNVCRFFLGGHGFIPSFLISTLGLIILPLVNKKYDKQSVPIKALIATTIAIVEGLFVIFYTRLIDNVPFLVVQVNELAFIVCQALAMWIVIFVIETMRENVLYQREAILTEKIKAVSELSASISHEVRNPMTVVKGFLHMLDENELSSEKRHFYVKVSLTELERAEMIINDYLSMTKPQKEAFVLRTLEEDVHYVTNVIKPYSLMHNVTINETFDNKLLVRYDQNQLRQCLLNIMKNCIESMSLEGGELTIVTASNQDQVILTIKDTGVGMSAEQVHRLGTPYFSTKENGTGLGMMVVFSAIQSMNGKLQISSKKGKGSTFSISLPAHKEKVKIHHDVNVG